LSLSGGYGRGFPGPKLLEAHKRQLEEREIRR
jgi:hypothetical protein